MQFASRRAVLCLAAAVFAASAQAADGPAAALIDKVASEAIAVVKAKSGPEREAGIRAILISYFDLPFMGQAALGTHWAGTPAPQRERFLKAVVSAEARAFSERFGQYGGQTLTVDRTMPTSRGDGISVVSSKLTQTDGEPLAIQWDVRNGGQRSLIVDVRVEVVSMVVTRRAEYNSYIQAHGGQVEPLISELEARAKR